MIVYYLSHNQQGKRDNPIPPVIFLVYSNGLGRTVSYQYLSYFHFYSTYNHSLFGPLFIEPVYDESKTFYLHNAYAAGWGLESDSIQSVRFYSESLWDKLHRNAKVWEMWTYFAMMNCIFSVHLPLFSKGFLGSEFFSGIVFMYFTFNFYPNFLFWYVQSPNPCKLPNPSNLFFGPSILRRWVASRI